MINGAKSILFLLSKKFSHPIYPPPFPLHLWNLHYLSVPDCITILPPSSTTSFLYNTNYNNHTDWPGKSSKVEKSGFHPRRYGFARSKSAKTMYNASDSGSDKLTDGNTDSFWRMGEGKKCEKNSLCFHTGYFYPAIRLPPQIPTAGFFL